MLRLAWIIFACTTGVGFALNHGFKSYPTTVRTYENDTVWLPCYADDLGVQTRVRWWKESRTTLADTDEPVADPPERIRMWPNRTLQVSNVQPEDSGNYVCQVTRPAPWGHVTQVHEIEVMYPPSVHPVPESGELEVNLGEEVDMACVAKGVPLPVITWRTKDGEIPLLNDRPRLRFHADNRSLAGRYTCVANNWIGDPATATIDLRIRYKPEIEVRKTWVHASPGIRAQLDCGVTAWPEAKVEWFFKGEGVPYSSRIVKHTAGSNHSLVIRNVRTSDYGEYLCRATNSLGITEAIVELSGVANTAVIKESHSISKTAHNFIWEVDSYIPIIEYEFWFRKRMGARAEWHTLFIPSDSDDNGPVHARSYNLTGLAEATHYEALVFSRNRYGRSRPSKVIRFSTEGAPARVDAAYKTGVVPEDKTIPVVQLASMSQHSPLDATGGASCVRGMAFFMMLPAVYIASANLLGHASAL